MKLTSVFGLSFRFKHSFQAQLHDHSRRSHTVLLFAFQCLTRSSLGGWITLYSFPLFDTSFTGCLNNSILLCFSHFHSQSHTKSPGSNGKCREVAYQNANTVPSAKTKKKTHMFVSHGHVFLSIKKIRKRTLIWNFTALPLANTKGSLTSSCIFNV